MYKIEAIQLAHQNKYVADRKEAGVLRILRYVADGGNCPANTANHHENLAVFVKYACTTRQISSKYELVEGDNAISIASPPNKIIRVNLFRALVSNAESGFLVCFSPTELLGLSRK